MQGERRQYFEENKGCKDRVGTVLEGTLPGLNEFRSLQSHHFPHWVKHLHFEADHFVGFESVDESHCELGRIAWVSLLKFFLREWTENEDTGEEALLVE